MAGKTPAKEGPCAKCRTVVSDSFYCFGCKNFLCEDHGPAPMGRHRLEDHQKPCDVCGEHPDACIC